MSKEEPWPLTIVRDHDGTGSQAPHCLARSSDSSLHLTPHFWATLTCRQVTAQVETEGKGWASAVLISDWGGLSSHRTSSFLPPEQETNEAR